MNIRTAALILSSAVLASIAVPEASAQEGSAPMQLPPGFVKELKHAPDGHVARLQVQVAGRSISRFFPDSLRDGPHVSWSGDTPTVRYACFGETPERVLSPGEQRFGGYCEDEDRQYAIQGTYDAPPAAFDSVGRVFVIGNVHGSMVAVTDLLQSAGILDASNRWQWGDGHLVVLGNILDRGPHVTEVLWLLHSLESEARAQGGAVHLLLGPAEASLLTGGEGRPHWKYGTNGLESIAEVPYAALYGEDTELGRWLRSRNGVLRINGMLFAAGGLNPEASWEDVGLEEINESVRTYVGGSSDSETTLRAGDHGRSPLFYTGFIGSEHATPAPAAVKALLEKMDARWMVVRGNGAAAASLVNGRVFTTAGPMEDEAVAEGILVQRGRFTRVTAEGTWTGLPAAR